MPSNSEMINPDEAVYNDDCQLDSLHYNHKTPKNYKPHNHDVLLGRRNIAIKHKGNEILHQFAARRKEDYRNAFFREQRKLIAEEVLSNIKTLDPPGRFLTATTKSCSEKFGKKDFIQVQWSEVDHEKSIVKICQALREQAKQQDGRGLLKFSGILDKSKRTSSNSQLQSKASSLNISSKETILNDRKIIKLNIINEPRCHQSYNISKPNITRKNCCSINYFSSEPTEKSNYGRNTNVYATTKSKRGDEELFSKSNQGIFPNAIEVTKNVQYDAFNLRQEPIPLESNIIYNPILTSEQVRNYSLKEIFLRRQRSLDDYNGKEQRPKEIIPVLRCDSNEIRGTKRQNQCIELESSRKSRQKNECDHHKQIAIPVSFIGQSFLANPVFSFESRCVLEEIVDLRAKKDGLLHLPTIITSLCTRIEKLEEINQKS